MFTLSPLEIEALSLSVRVALWAVLVSLPFGVAVAWLLARSRFPGKALVDALVHVPLVVPPVVIGYLLLVLLGRRGVIGAWLWDSFGVTVAFTWQGAAVASAVMALSASSNRCRAASRAGPSASRGTWIGSPHTNTPRPKGQGTTKRSQVANTRRRSMEKVAGRMGASDRRARLTMPLLARILGPWGPSGVMPTDWPSFSILSKVRSALEPPCRVDPATVPTLK